MVIGIILWALLMLENVSLLGTTAQADRVFGKVRQDGARLEMLVPPSGPECPRGEEDIRQDSGIWSTVSLDMFDFYEADLACQQLGSRYANEVKPVTADTPTSTERYALVEVANVSCPLVSSGVILFDCQFSPGTCDHSRDVALICSIETNPVRLVPQAATRPAETVLVGRLELIIGSQPGTVCSDSFDMLDADVACQQFGRSEGAVAFGTAQELGYDSSENPIWLSGLMCTQSDAGIDANLRMCVHDGTLQTGSCDHNRDVILSCLADGALRLIRNESDLTSISTSGRLEIYSSGQWGTVCGVSFNQKAADLACRQLGFTGALQYGTNLGFPEASDLIPIMLGGGLVCSENDTNILQCSLGNETCSHSDDVGIVCSTATSPVDPVTTSSSPSDSVDSTASTDSLVLGLGAIIGIAVGGCVLIFLVCCLCLTCCYCCKCCRSRKGKEDKGQDEGARGRAMRTLSDPPTVPAPRPPPATIARTNVIEQKSYQTQLSSVSHPQEPRYVYQQQSREPALYQTSSVSSQQRDSYHQQGNPQGLYQQPNHQPGVYLLPQTSSISSQQRDSYHQQGVAMNPNQTQGPQSIVDLSSCKPELYMLPQTSSISSQQRDSYQQQGYPQESQQSSNEPASYMLPQTSSISSQQRGSYYQHQNSQKPPHVQQPNNEPASYTLPQRSSISSQQRGSYQQQGYPQEPRYDVQQPNNEPASYTLPQRSSVSSQQRDSYYQQQNPQELHYDVQQLNNGPALYTQPQTSSQQRDSYYRDSAEYSGSFVPPSHPREQQYGYDRLHYPNSRPSYPPINQRSHPQNVTNPGYMLSTEALPIHRHDLAAPPRSTAASPYLDPNEAVPSAPPLPL